MLFSSRARRPIFIRKILILASIAVPSMFSSFRDLTFVACLDHVHFSSLLTYEAHFSRPLLNSRGLYHNLLPLFRWVDKPGKTSTTTQLNHTRFAPSICTDRLTVNHRRDRACS